MRRGRAFATAHVTLTQGTWLGADAGAALVKAWDQVNDRTHDIVPAYGFTQAEREEASAGAAQAMV